MPNPTRASHPALIAAALFLTAAACTPTRTRQDSTSGTARDTSSSGTASNPNNAAAADAGVATAPSDGGGAECATDDDCVRASCCHPTACTARAQAPQCENAMCTEECRGNTLDCGGHCACESGHCVAHFARILGAPVVR